jgi:predicted MFS family arabinose efflux permease
MVWLSADCEMPSLAAARVKLRSCATARKARMSLMFSRAMDYAVLMAGRALLGVSIGGFWSMSTATVMRLVRRDDVPRALAILNGGNALAATVAAPLGSFLGAYIGWRGAFFCVVPLAVLTFVWLRVTLPPLPAERQSGAGAVFRLLGRPQVALGMLAILFLFMGQFALFTYLRPFLETVTGVDVRTLSLILLATGVAGFVGTTVIGRLLKTGLYRTLIIIPVLMAVIAVALIGFGRNTGAVAVLLAMWGLVATAAPVGWWTWVASTMPDSAESGGGLMVAVVQLAIALGSTLGGLLFDMVGYGSSFAASALLLLVAAFLAFLASRAGARSASVKLPGAETMR